MAFTKITVPTLDVTGRMLTRLLSQFYKSPVFNALVAAFATELQALADTIRDVTGGRMPATAAGTNLDVLGRIVGQGRELLDYSVISWFAPDTEDRGADLGPAWDIGAPTGSAIVMADGDFRQLLEAKATRNTTLYGSVPELQDFIKKAFGLKISVKQRDHMTVELVVENGVSDDVLNYLRHVTDLPVAERVYFLPIPATTGITAVTRQRDFVL